MEQIGCPETSVRNYHSALRRILEELRSRVHRGANLKSREKFSINGSSDLRTKELLRNDDIYSDTSANEDNSFRNHIR